MYINQGYLVYIRYIHVQYTMYMVFLWLVSVDNMYYLTYLMTSSTLLVAVFIF